jgi:HSP20 family protein
MANDFNRHRHSLFFPSLKSCREAHWRPPADVYRMPNGWLVKFELAGVRPEEITVTVRDRTLTVRGCRRDWFAQESHSHYLMEIAYSCFERQINLPFDLDRAEITTEYQEGMLLVRIRTETES